MPDTELMSRAARAAAELEDAWSRWRVARGQPADAASSITSYVAHAIDHPLGQPRVLLGIDADDALALAEMLRGVDESTQRADTVLPEPLF